MIQKLNARRGSTAVAPYRQSTSLSTDGPDTWGTWYNRKFYSLEVIQQPIRARMCGFGDKDRRPLAPATVAKVVIRNEDDTLVEDDDIDCSFFLVTADLWSSDGKLERNLVLHPTSSDRYITTHAPKKRRSNAHPQSSQPPGEFQGTGPPNASPGPSRRSLNTVEDHTTNNLPPIPPSLPPSFNVDPYPYPQPPPPDTISLQPAHTYNAIPDSSDWAYGLSQPLAPSSTTRPSTTSIALLPASPDPWQTSPDPDPTTSSNQYRWNLEPLSTSPAPAPAPPYAIELRESPAASWMPPQTQTQTQTQTASMVAGPHNPPYDQSMYASASAGAVGGHRLPGHAYTRTLVGPLSANASRLLDEHRKPGVFFLFQDLSIRTEGSFRLRLRLMNIGAPPAPEAGAQHVHTDVSPILAQTFTDAFDVYSAKRFPGVPDTTALSIAFGNQGQKLPLRNRHGSSKQGRRRRRGDSDGSDDDSDRA